MLALPQAGWGATGDIDVASRATGAAGVKGNNPSYPPNMSGDGHAVEFRSVATNLDPADTDTNNDMYVRDVPSSVTTLISRATGADGAKSNGSSAFAAISDNGRFAAYQSTATNLDPSDTDTTTDVYVRDLQTNTTVLISRATGASGSKGNGFSGEPSISGDGRYVAFSSNASNLDPDDTTTGSDVYVRDLQTDSLTLVSRTTGAAGVKGNFASSAPYISDDGRVVGFQSSATNLDLADTASDTDVYVRDTQTATTTLVSRAGGSGAKGNGSSVNPSLSDDGGRIAFESNATNLSPDDTDTATDILVRDLAADTTTLASRASGATGAKGNAAAPNLSLSGDGTTVAFQSAATNLDPADTDATTDLFVRDLLTNKTTLVSRAGAAGPKGNGGSAGASLSDDGTLVAFQSSASNLTPDDPDAIADVFRRQLAPRDTDDDGTPDSSDVCPANAGDAAADGCPVVDSSSANKSVAPVYTSAPLTNGQAYTVTVRGTDSTFAAALMAPNGQRTKGWAICGTPEATNVFASPGIPNARAGQDPEFLFSFPQTGTKCSAKNQAALPKRQSALRFDTGTGYTTPTANNTGSTPDANHTYAYTVIGAGAPLKVKVQDSNYKDNSGRFSIKIETATVRSPST